MICIGADLGVTGAVAMIDSVTRDLEVVDLQTVQTDYGTRIDGRDLHLTLARWASGHVYPTLWMEDVRVRPSEGRPGVARTNRAATEGSLVRSRGIMECAADVAGISCFYVFPQTWKKQYGLGADKDAARQVAARMFPALADAFKRVADHNRAEAMLIAYYGMRETQG